MQALLVLMWFLNCARQVEGPPERPGEILIAHSSPEGLGQLNLSCWTQPVGTDGLFLGLFSRIQLGVCLGTEQELLPVHLCASSV